MGLFSKKNKNKQGSSRDSTTPAAAALGTTDTTATTVTPSFSGPTDRIQVAASSNDVDPTVNGDRLGEWVQLTRL